MGLLYVSEKWFNMTESTVHGERNSSVVQLLYKKTDPLEWTRTFTR